MQNSSVLLLCFVADWLGEVVEFNSSNIIIRGGGKE